MDGAVSSQPLRMARPAPRRTGNATAATALGILVVFVIVATAVAIKSNNDQRALIGGARSAATATAIEDRMVSYTEVLYGVRSHFALGLPTRESYRDLMSGLDLDDRYEGVQVIGAAELVARADLRPWESESRAEMDASVVDYPQLVVYPDTVDNQKLPISYIDPVEGNEQALGLDFLSEPNRRSAANRARDSGGPAATAPITLVQETGTQLAILMMVPFYEGNTTPESIAERRASFQGVVYAAFRMGDLLNAVLGTTGGELVDVVDVGADALLFENRTTRTSPRGSGDSTHEQSLVVGGREWLVTVNTPPDALSSLESTMPAIILLGGLAIALLIAGLIRSTRSAQARATDLAWEMTTELEAITESAGEAIVSVDVNGDIVAWNRGATEMFGIGAADVLGTPITQFVPEHTREAFREGHDAAMASPIDQGEPAPIDLTVCRADGTEFPIELSTSRWEVLGETFRTGFARDLTERVQAQAALQQTTETLVAVLEAATELSIIGTDEDGTVEVFNRGAERMLGFVAEDVIGQLNLADFHDADELAARAADLGMTPGFDVLSRAARQNRAEARRWTYLRADGKGVPVKLTVTPMHDGDGVLTGFIGVAIDITEQIRTESAQAASLEQQAELVEKLTELDRVKNDFVSTMSHELRTPLASIIGFTELLTDAFNESGDAANARLVGMVERNAERLLTLVEDILTLSQIESGSFKLRRESTDCATLLHAATDAVRPLAAQSDIAIDLRIDGPLWVLADRPQMERVFLNLLSNAVKFSNGGSTVSVHATRQSDDVIVTVEDHGVGIPLDEQNQLFTRFLRSRVAEQQSIPGTGLGLAIVHNIVDRHGGTIGVTSAEGMGTTITVTVPGVADAPLPQPPQEAIA